MAVAACGRWQRPSSSREWRMENNVDVDADADADGRSHTPRFPPKRCVHVRNFNDGIGGKSGERYLTKANMVYILKDT